MKLLKSKQKLTTTEIKVTLCQPTSFKKPNNYSVAINLNTIHSIPLEALRVYDGINGNVK
jgi:hypothetical protein